MMDIQPMAADGTISIRPIGVIRSAVGKQQTGGFGEVEATVELNTEFRDYLVGIQDYSHFHILYWLNEMTETHGLHRPQSNSDVPVVGMFACRCPQRPNPVGLTTVELISVDGTNLRVRGLDAIDGTPVIDIKPYYPPYDQPQGEIRVPDWIWKLAY